MKRALIVGIDHYNNQALTTCETDAKKVSELLERNGDGSKNFDTKLVLSAEKITRESLLADIKQLFASPAEVALLYYAGHGFVEPETTAGYLITPDCETEGHGVALGDIVTLASQGHHKNGIKSTVIILDCCQSGSAAELQGFSSSVLGQGMTILTATDRNQSAATDGHHGLFSRILIDALDSAAADIRGFITPASVYSHVDQTLGAWEQRPVYKANVREFSALRRVKPKVPDEVLSQLPKWFITKDYEYPLNPSFEPKIKEGTEADYSDEIREKNQAIFSQMQLCNRYGLIEPVETEHMYFAAMDSKACKLTALGQYYRNLVLKKII